MAPKKKGVSFVKTTKVSVGDKKPAKATAKATSIIKKQQQKVAKKETQGNKINRLAPAKAGKQQTVQHANKKKQLSKRRNSKKFFNDKSRKKKDVTCPPYVALQLRNLPPAFQEPQLRKFLTQFGVPVSQTYVQRTKKRATSRGLAYVRFTPKDANQEKLMDVVLDEVNAMNLGGKTVQAKWVTLKRLMPSRKAVDARRALEEKNKTQGHTLERFDVSHFDWVAKLRRSAKNEGAANKFLKSIGLNYTFTGFSDQLKQVPENVRTASNAAQKAVKATRLATKVGRRKGFSNAGMLKKTIEKKRLRKAAKKAKKAAKAEGGATAAATTTAATTTKASPAKKVAAKKAGKK